MKRLQLIVAFLAIMGLGSACVPDATGGVVPHAGVDCGPPPALTSGADLAGCVLAGLDLSGLNLSGANLAGANLSGANLSGASLVQANLEGANLTGANLTGANLTGAILSGAILLGALFINAILNGALFDFGVVYGNDGLGGTTTQANSACVGAYCPGYNNASGSLDDYLCDPDLDQEMGEGFYVTRTEHQLQLARSRGVVTNRATDFTGASFSANEDGVPVPRGLDMRDANFTSTSWDGISFACRSLDGARFAGSEFVESEFQHVSAVDANFSGSYFFSALFCDADFTGSQFPNTVWEGFDGLSCVDFVPRSEIELLPDPLVRFDDTDFTNSTMGGVEDPERGTLWAMAYEWDGVARSVSLRGATLDGIHVTDGLYWNADLRDTTAAGATFVGTSRFEGAVFSQDDGWDDATFTGVAGFDGALCPDGSTATVTTPCFITVP